MNGTFVWFDLSTTDTAAAARFYADTLGWSVEKHSPDGSYDMWKGADGRPFGGIMTLVDAQKAMGAPPNWMGYVAVEDVDQAAAKCTSLGGAVHVPGTDIAGGAARFAVLADPQGAVFAVYANTHEDGGSENSQISWVELYTSDVQGALAFYGEMFGWKVTQSMDMGPEHGSYEIFAVGGKDRGGVMKRPPTVPMSAFTYYFRVDDTLARTERCKEHGAKVMMGPMEVPGGDWITVFTDPQGAVFAIHAPNSIAGGAAPPVPSPNQA